MIGGRHTLLLTGYGEGRFGGGENENVLVGGNLRHFVRTVGTHQLHTSIRVDMADNLDPDRQLLIGGDSGLRGYPRRFQSGDRRYLFTIEHRWYTDLELFNLIHVGAAAFFDPPPCPSGCSQVRTSRQWGVTSSTLTYGPRCVQHGPCSPALWTKTSRDTDHVVRTDGYGPLARASPVLL